jgi:hypothetical protein
MSAPPVSMIDILIIAEFHCPSARLSRSKPVVYMEISPQPALFHHLITNRGCSLPANHVIILLRPEKKKHGAVGSPRAKRIVSNLPSWVVRLLDPTDRKKEDAACTA